MGKDAELEDVELPCVGVDVGAGVVSDSVDVPGPEIDIKILNNGPLNTSDTICVVGVVLLE